MANAIAMLEHSRYHQYEWDKAPGKYKAVCFVEFCRRDLRFDQYFWVCQEHGQVLSPKWISDEDRPPCPWCKTAERLPTPKFER